MSESPGAIPGNAPALQFTAGSFTQADLKVVSFKGSETLSELFGFEIELVAEDAEIDYASLVGQPGALMIQTPTGSRFVNGLVREVERIGDREGPARLQVRLVPALWQLTRRYGSRIFQEHVFEDGRNTAQTTAMTFPAIVERILVDAGFAADQYRFALQGSYAVHEFVVQYRETEYDFITRLMAEVGVYFFFEHFEDKHVIVFGDGPTAHTPLETAEWPFRSRDGLVGETESVYEVRDRTAVDFGAVTLDDFDFTKPATDLSSNTTAEQFTDLAYTEYPGRFLTTGDGATLAKVRQEAFEARRRRIVLHANIPHFVPGAKFTLKDHPLAALNQEYLLLQCMHEGRQPQAGEEHSGGGSDSHYRIEVGALPAALTYRPEQAARRPVIPGVQTATVTGPEGEEIHTDKYGRVKVQFHWDPYGEHNEKSSCWIRVAQRMAGGNYGAVFLPRIGQEVCVEFIEGDPDRPLIVGSVYNADHMPPYTLPDEKTKSTIKTNSTPEGSGFNEIRFEDLKDKEQLFIHAQKDQDNRVLNDSKTWVGAEKHLQVIGKQFEIREDNHNVKIAKDRKTAIEGNEEFKVTSDRNTQIEGAENLAVGGDRAVKVTGDDNHQVEANLNMAVSSKLSLDVGTDLHQQVGGNLAADAGSEIHVKAGSDLVLEAGSKVTILVGGSSVVIDASGVSIQGTAINLNSGGAPGAGSGVQITEAADPAEPAAPEDALEADKAEAGSDTTYQQVAVTPQALALESAQINAAAFCEICEKEDQAEDAEEEAVGDAAEGTSDRATASAAGAAGPASDAAFQDDLPDLPEAPDAPFGEGPSR